MKFEELLKKTTPGDLVATPAGFLRDKNDDGLPLADVDLDPICDDLERANALRLAHSWNVLPHLLRAIERQRKCAADVLLDSSKAEQFVQSCAELAAAIAACKEVPDV